MTTMSPAQDGIRVLSANKDTQIGLGIFMGPVNTFFFRPVGVKQAQAYAMEDLMGTWVGVAFGIPGLNSVNGEYSFETQRLIINADGSFTSICERTSDDNCEVDIYPAGSISIAADGTITPPPDPGGPDYLFMNAGKDLIIHLFRGDTDEEYQVSIFAKR